MRNASAACLTTVLGSILWIRFQDFDNARLSFVVVFRQAVRFAAKVMAQSAQQLYPPNHDSPRSCDQPRAADRAGLGRRRRQHV